MTHLNSRQRDTLVQLFGHPTTANLQWVDLTFHVREGQQYRVSNIGVEGPKQLDRQQVESILQTQAADLSFICHGSSSVAPVEPSRRRPASPTCVRERDL